MEGIGIYTGGTEVVEDGVALTLLCREHAIEAAQSTLDVFAETSESDFAVEGLVLMPLNTKPELATSLKSCLDMKFE